MTSMKLTPVRFENGVWEGHLSGSEPPEIEVFYLGDPMPDVEVASDSDGWALRVTVPQKALSEGVHSLVIWDAAAHEKLDTISIIAGSPAADNLLAEVDLLRAELDMLKRVVRRMHQAGQ